MGDLSKLSGALQFLVSPGAKVIWPRPKRVLIAKEFVAKAIKAHATILGESVNERRRLVSLQKFPGFQESLCGHHTIQPSETSHAVEYVEACDGISLCKLAAVPIATVLIGFMLIPSLRVRLRALLKRFRTW